MSNYEILEEVLEELDKLAQEGQQDDIIRVCGDSLRRFPRSAELFFSRAQARVNKGDRVGAIADVSVAIKLDHGEPAVFYFRGLWRIEEGAVRAAMEDLSAALVLEESLGTEYYTDSTLLARAVCWLLLGQFERAIEDSSRVRGEVGVFVRGRLWKCSAIREFAGHGRIPK